ncbi:MAG TPA: hypothetical protein VGR25_06970 [bacterium]|nr:hypothetical protein [bacterium]
MALQQHHAQTVVQVFDARTVHRPPVDEGKIRRLARGGRMPLEENPMEIVPGRPESGAVYRCTVCGRVFPREDPLPEECPTCGSPKELFVLQEED